MSTEPLTLRWPDANFPSEVFATLCGPGAFFEIERDTVAGVEMDVFVRRPRSLRELLLNASKQFPDRCYIADERRELTFGEVVPAVAAVAQSLANDFGIGKGDRVAISSANRVEYALTFWAATALGAITVAMNGWWTGPEMEFALELTDPKVLFGDTRRLERLAPSFRPELPRVEFESAFAALEAAGAGASVPDVEIHEDDPFLVLFTSGTTGRPKGALLSHRSNIHFMYSVALRAAEGMMREPASAPNSTVAAPAPATPPDPPCVISASPLFHVSGLNCQLVMALMSGMTIVYPPVGKWDEATHLQLSAKHRATAWSLVPTQLWRVLEWPTLADYDLSALKAVGGGSAVWPPELLRTLGERLPGVRTGLGLGYGMTETNGLGTSLRGKATFERPTSVGEVVPTVQVQVRDPETGEPLGEGEVGEICMRSAANFLGYWANEEATASVLVEDRWYRTGDHGHITDGFVYLEGRRSDLIIRGGENIYPAEIEIRLIEHPDIVEVAVVGVEHPTLGQEVKAYVVARERGVLDVEAVRAFAGETLANYKVPTYVEFLDELPHNASGKVLKHALGKPAEDVGFVAETDAP